MGRAETALLPGIAQALLPLRGVVNWVFISLFGFAAIILFLFSNARFRTVLEQFGRKPSKKVSFVETTLTGAFCQKAYAQSEIFF
jgi:hypothetical protein